MYIPFLHLCWSEDGYRKSQGRTPAPSILKYFQCQSIIYLHSLKLSIRPLEGLKPCCIRHFHAFCKYDSELVFAQSTPKSHDDQVSQNSFGSKRTMSDPACALHLFSSLFHTGLSVLLCILPIVHTGSCIIFFLPDDPSAVFTR